MNNRYARMMDKNEIYELFCDMYQTSFRKDAFEDMLWENINNPFMTCIVVVEKETVVAYVSFTIHSSIHQMGRIARIEEFLVKKQNIQIAQVLFDGVVHKVNKIGCQHMEIDLMDNHVLHELDEVKKKAVKIPTIYQLPL